MSAARIRLAVAVALLLIAGALIAALPSHASGTATMSSGAIAATTSPTAKPAVTLPDVSPLYRLMVEREAADVWGIDAPTARIAGQIHQESTWNPQARSPYADGLAQFTPQTAEWIAKKFPAQLGDFDPFNPSHAVRAMVIYDDWLLRRNPGATPCDTWAFALAAYNGGEGWLRRDQKRASAKGADPARWWGHVEAHSARAGWAFKENRGYPRKILKRWEPAYIAAGWSGAAVCGSDA